MIIRFCFDVEAEDLQRCAISYEYCVEGRKLTLTGVY